MHAATEGKLAIHRVSRQRQHNCHRFRASKSQGAKYQQAIDYATKIASLNF
jgi:hypothetical protein